MAEPAKDYLRQFSVVDGGLDEEKYGPATEPPLKTGGSDGRFSDMNERLGKLEGAYDGLKQSQAIMIGAVAIVSAVLLGSTLYLVSRVDQLGNQVSDLPSKISAEMRDINSMLIRLTHANPRASI